MLLNRIIFFCAIGWSLHGQVPGKAAVEALLKATIKALEAGDEAAFIALWKENSPVKSFGDPVDDYEWSDESRLKKHFAEVRKGWEDVLKKGVKVRNVRHYREADDVVAAFGHTYYFDIVIAGGKVCGLGMSVVKVGETVKYDKSELPLTPCPP